MKRQIAIRLDGELISGLDGLAEQLRTSRNQLIERLLEEGTAALIGFGVQRIVAEAWEKVGPAVSDELAKPAPDAPKELPEPDPTDVWSQDKIHSPGNEKRHFHSYETVDEGSVEYRGGDKYAYLACRCGKLSPVKEKVRPSKEK